MIMALVIAITEAVYQTVAFDLVVNWLGFHIYISIVILIMMLMLKGVRARVSFVVIVLCFLALIVNMVSFWIDALGYDSEMFFEIATYSLFGLEVLAILNRNVTDGLFRAFSSVNFLRDYIRGFSEDNRGLRE